MEPQFSDVPTLRHDASNSDVWWLALSRCISFSPHTKALALHHDLQFRRYPVLQDYMAIKASDLSPVVDEDILTVPTNHSGLRTNLDDFLASKGLFDVDVDGRRTGLIRILNYIGIRHNSCISKPKYFMIESGVKRSSKDKIDWEKTHAQRDAIFQQYEAAVSMYHNILATIDKNLQERYNTQAPATIELLVSIFMDPSFSKSMDRWGERQLYNAANTVFITDLKTYLSEMSEINFDIKKLNKLQEVGQEFYEYVENALPESYWRFCENSVIKVGFTGTVRANHFEILCAQIKRYVQHQKKAFPDQEFCEFCLVHKHKTKECSKRLSRAAVCDYEPAPFEEDDFTIFSLDDSDMCILGHSGDTDSSGED